MCVVVVASCSCSSCSGFECGYISAPSIAPSRTIGIVVGVVIGIVGWCSAAAHGGGEGGVCCVVGVGWLGAGRCNVCTAACGGDPVFCVTTGGRMCVVLVRVLITVI